MLSVDGHPVAKADIRTCLRFSLTGEGLCVGFDDGDAVSSLYRPRIESGGGTLHRVTFETGTDLHVDHERHLNAAMARD